MARVSLHFEDAEDGLVDFRADYKLGYDAESHAHTLANQVVQFLEREATSKTFKPDEQTTEVVSANGLIIR